MWEKAKLIPIHKSEETTNRANYRPISILAILSKVLETHVFKAYLSYLTFNSIHSSDKKACSEYITEKVKKCYNKK
jgi:hypothetical protein